jgi:phosphoenolpyruvate carboxykinase (GTP)
MGATISSEQTAAAEGIVGALRRDPFAMLPFCGYNMGDYWQHWLNVGLGLKQESRPRIFQVNWFRKDANGKFLWPGFGENARVIEWIARRLNDEVLAGASAIGNLPIIGDLNVDGLAISPEQLSEIFKIDTTAWSQEADLTEAYFAKFGERLPAAMSRQLELLRGNLVGTGASEIQVAS